MYVSLDSANSIYLSTSRSRFLLEGELESFLSTRERKEKYGKESEANNRNEQRFNEGLGNRDVIVFFPRCEFGWDGNGS